MTDATMDAPASAPAGNTNYAPILFGVVVFLSASLVFLVEPMVAKLLLPSQGGSPMVWNTCMAFFQMALLAGYGYAHLLQRIKSVKTQAIIHAAVLVVAASVLPLRISTALGDPGATPPALWLLGVLALTLGPPFAALSATAPLAQAWYARVRAGHADASNPYVLYAASNLGSLIALVAYPVIVEPGLRLTTQALSWSVGYGAFVLLMVGAAFFAARSKAQVPAAAVVEEEQEAAPISWKDRLIWIGLAAAPSSLMLGVTTHITTDIASAPFLWVAPLALYLLTFIFAFSGRKIIPYEISLIFHGVLVAAMAATFNVPASWLLMQLLLHLAAFFFTAMVCHQGLARRRPHPSKLTEFYLLISIGGVIGGSFNAFLAPVIFKAVWEYPVVMVLACLARPWSNPEKAKAWEEIVFGLVLGCLAVATVVHFIAPHLPIKQQYDLYDLTSHKLTRMAFALTSVAAFLLRDRIWFYVALIAAITFGSFTFGPKADLILRDRSFFGVLKVTETVIPDLGKVRLIAHGTTLHGAQALDEPYRCRPMVYYSPFTPIGQVFAFQRSAKGKLVIGAVGMGAGTVAAYTQPGDELRFFEIDQKVIDISGNKENFSYIDGCSRGIVTKKLGDARLTLRKEPKGVYDILLIDAFSSDAVPAHLLTVEAMKEYLSHLTPDGIVIMHLSNRHLDLMEPVAAVAHAAGGYALGQGYKRTPGPDFVDSSEEAIIVARSPEALRQFKEDPRWLETDPTRAKPWTDDYTNLFGAMMSNLRQQFRDWRDGRGGD